MSLPPGPRQPALLQTWQWSQRPLALLDACARRYGATFRLRFTGFGDMVVFSEPAHLKQLFTGDPSVLLAGRANRLVEPLLGSTSIILLDGAQHLRQRRLLLPPFHGERMSAYAEVMREITEASIERWPLGQPFAIHPFMRSITFEVILRAVFGLEEGAAMRELGAMLLELFTPPPPLLLFFPALQRDVPLSPYRKFLRIRERTNRALFELIAERRRAPDLAERTDILSLMLLARDEDGQPMSDAEVRDELVTMIAAGHDTTATTLAWAFAEILAQPEIGERLGAEAQAIVDGPLDGGRLGQMEFTDAVVKETLRLRPIVPAVVRYLAAPFPIAGYELPAGTYLAAAIHLTHRRGDLYPDPERFHPERFIGAKFDPYQWLPFGGGVRRCLGMAFALLEAKIVLGAVMARTRLRLAEERPRAVRRGVTLAPESGTLLVLEERRPRPSLPGARSAA